MRMGEGDKSEGSQSSSPHGQRTLGFPLLTPDVKCSHSAFTETGGERGLEIQP